jgi:hypothetical protein
MTRTIIFLCDSHMGALNEGLGQIRSERHNRSLGEAIHFIMPDVGNLSRDFMLTLEDGRKVLNPVLVKEFDNPWSPPHRKTPQVLNRWTNLSPLAGVDHEMVVLWGFAELHVFGCAPKWADYGINDENFVTPAGKEAPVLLPRALVKDTLAKYVLPVFEVVDYLKSKGLRISMLAGPPPPSDNAIILEHLPGMAPAAPRTRLSIYQIMLELYREYTKSADLRFFEVPRKLRDEEGFLLPDYCRDGVHANAAYGHEILLSIEPELLLP